MPIYDYKCRECGRIWETLLLSGESEPVCCPGCGGSSLERLVCAPYIMKSRNGIKGATCCGRAERCEAPPCSTGESCRKK